MIPKKPVPGLFGDGRRFSGMVVRNESLGSAPRALTSG